MNYPLHVFAFFLLVWIAFQFWVLREPEKERDSDNLSRLHQRLTETVLLMNKVRADNAELDVQIEHLKLRIQQVKSTSDKIHMDTFNATLIVPSKEYELLRRRIHSNVKEFSYYVNSELESLDRKEKGTVRRIKEMKNMLVEHFRSLLKDITDLADVDDHSTWREQESENLSRLIQNRLDDLQNPLDCSIAKQLVCNLNKVYGFSYKFHHLVYCFIVAYETQRMLVLTPMKYNNVWQKFFFTLNGTCPLVMNKSISQWTGNQTDQIVQLPIIDDVHPKPRLLPPVLPDDFASRLNVLHGDPMVWWIGQFLKFIFLPQPTISNIFDECAEKMKFQNPTVGVHVRRADKINKDAGFHALEEYMIHVEEYYKLKELSGQIKKKRIYLATDEPNLFAEAKRKYPEYEIICNENISKTAFKKYDLRKSLIDLIIDIHFLSLSDYLVCRIAYALMNSLHPDASERYASLDDIYYFGGQSHRLNEAVLQHNSNRPQEIDLQIGDQIFVDGNRWNGYSKGKNLRTHKTGLYPTFKAISKIESAIVHAYSNSTA
ncbi:alpha-(1,6)-fucosyltransferase-like isoform X2 [Sipha flava]|uniref:Alpha-(1,6)-fucosyltransferase-like isoform X2 n=1 Tax=Sipha flava TaxID=143950 RepID=A0A8B8GC83_9HEMI|nr:alpha-(1,6)-fucosyltransferase-like isoform X2 [Sipha flava]